MLLEMKNVHHAVASTQRDRYRIRNFLRLPLIVFSRNQLPRRPAVIPTSIYFMFFFFFVQLLGCRSTYLLTVILVLSIKAHDNIEIQYVYGDLGSLQRLLLCRCVAGVPTFVFIAGDVSKLVFWNKRAAKKK